MDVKALVLLFVVFLGALSVNAAEVLNSSPIVIEPAKVTQVTPLRLKNRSSQVQQRLSVVVTDEGLSTDVSPRFKIYIGFSSYAEMGNMTANFLLTDRAHEVLLVTGAGDGYYKIKFTELRAAGFVEVTKTIDVAELLTDEEILRYQCGDDFCDKVLQSILKVTETTKPLRTENR